MSLNRFVHARANTMSGRRAGFSVVAAVTVLVAVFGATSPLSAVGAAWHIGLASSVPAKDAHVMKAPSEIRLTFTGPVDVKKAGIELVDSASKSVATDSLRAVADSSRVAVAKITGRLVGGTYTVRWKAIAADGAAGSGSFSFMYMPMEPKH